MAKLTLHGVVQNVLHVDSRKDKQTGEIYPAKDQVQLLTENVMPNGDKRLDLVTLTIEHPEAFKKLVGRQVSIPVGVIGNPQFFALKGLAAPSS